MSIIARIVKEFEGRYGLDMSKIDNHNACNKTNPVQCIIETNGYNVNYDSNNKKIKIK